MCFDECRKQLGVRSSQNSYLVSKKEDLEEGKKGMDPYEFSSLMKKSRHLSAECVSPVCSDCISPIGFGGGVVAMVQPIQAPMPRTTMNAMSTGIATSQSRMASRVGQKSATV